MRMPFQTAIPDVPKPVSRNPVKGLLVTAWREIGPKVCMAHAPRREALSLTAGPDNLTQSSTDRRLR